MMESVLPEYDMFGFVRERSGASLPGIVPSNTYVTRDGKYVVIGANADSIFKRMMNAIGRADLANDPALAHNDGRVARTEEIEKVIGDWVAAHDLEHVLAVLERADVPSGKIFDIADIAGDAHYAARGDDPGIPPAGRHAGQAAGHRAEDVGDAGRHALDRAGARRAHRGSAGSAGLQRRRAAGTEAARRDLAAMRERVPTEIANGRSR